MKKQTQGHVDPKEMSELVNNYRVKKNPSPEEVTRGPEAIVDLVENHRNGQKAPPIEAKRGEDGRYAISKAEAAQYWFKAAKEQHPDHGFLGVKLKKVDEQGATGKFENNRPAEKMLLYEGKKKEIVEE